MQGFRWRKSERDRIAGDRPGGWPQRRALAAAMMLHAAIIACAIIDWHRPASAPAAELVPVRLVMAPSPGPELEPGLVSETGSAAAIGEPALPDTPPPLASVATEEGPPPPPPVVVEEPKAASEPMADGAESKPLPPPRAKPKAPPRKARVAARTDPPKDKPPPAAEPATPGVAVYHVLVAANGDIRSITLARSSGTKAFDDAGIEVVRNTIFEAQAQGQTAETTGFFEVTLHFAAGAP